jgi:hypothetical protein
VAIGFPPGSFGDLHADLRRWNQFVGCSCGWRPPELADRFDVKLWAEHVQQARSNRISEAVAALNQARRELDSAVRAARYLYHPLTVMTWEQIGKAAHMTRQSAQERWGKPPGSRVDRS